MRYRKINIKYARVIPFVLMLNCVFIDALGQTRNGKTGIYLSWLIGLIGVVGIVSFVIIKFKRKKATTKHPEVSIQNWDYNRTVEYIQFIFRQIQFSWVNRDIDSISEYITESFYKRFESHYYLMLGKGEKDIISSITVNTVEIQGMADKIDADANLLNVYISSEMVVYTIDEKLRQIVFNAELAPQEFIFNLQFVKENDRWLLDNIQNVNSNVTISDMFSLKVR